MSAAPESSSPHILTFPNQSDVNKQNKQKPLCTAIVCLLESCWFRQKELEGELDSGRHVMKCHSCAVVILSSEKVRLFSSALRECCVNFYSTYIATVFSVGNGLAPSPNALDRICHGLIWQVKKIAQWTVLRMIYSIQRNCWRSFSWIIMALLLNFHPVYLSPIYRGSVW